jgi:hypothetical protein
MHPESGHKIEKERIEAVKRSVDLVALVKSRGIDLKKNGKGYKGHCPFHEDNKSPSLSVTPAGKESLAMLRLQYRRRRDPLCGTVRQGGF